MRRRSTTRALIGIVLLVLACGAALLSRGVADAERDFRGQQAQWQRGLVARPPQPDGPAQELAESLMGIRARSEVMAAYLEYRFKLGSVEEGAVFPQTQARWNAISTIGRLRPSLTSARDRASVDVTLGVVYARSAQAAGSGALRQKLLQNAVEAFRRGVLEDPTTTDAKYDLEALLTAAARPGAQPRSRSDGRSDQQGKPTTTPQTQREGTGY